MFKMVLILAIRVLFDPVTPFKSLTKHCTCDTIYIGVCYLYKSHFSFTRISLLFLNLI